MVRGQKAIGNAADRQQQKQTIVCKNMAIIYSRTSILCLLRSSHQQQPAASHGDQVESRQLELKRQEHTAPLNLPLRTPLSTIRMMMSLPLRKHARRSCSCTCQSARSLRY